MAGASGSPTMGQILMSLMGEGRANQQRLAEIEAQARIQRAIEELRAKHKREDVESERTFDQQEEERKRGQSREDIAAGMQTRFPRLFEKSKVPEDASLGQLEGYLARFLDRAEKQQGRRSERQDEAKQLRMDIANIQDSGFVKTDYASQANALRGKGSLPALRDLHARALTEAGRGQARIRDQQMAAQAALLGGRNVSADLQGPRARLEMLKAQADTVRKSLDEIPDDMDVRASVGDLTAAEPIIKENRLEAMRLRQLLTTIFEEMQKLEREVTVGTPGADGLSAFGADLDVGGR